MSIRLEQTQKQILSQKMIQSVSILQMSAQELTEYIKEVALENPVVDFEENEPQESKENIERLKKLEWLAGLDEQNRSYYQYDRDDAENDFGVNNVSARASESLEDILHLQLLGGDYTPEEQEIFDYVINCLDSNGYFTVPASELAMVFGVSSEKAEHCLAILRNLEPAGVCASSMQDCLMRQLEKRKDCGEVDRAIVSEYMELLAKNQLHIIAKNLKVPIQAVIEAAARIKELNPRPAQGFDNGEMLRYVVPDITIVKFQGHLEILLNNYSCPVFHVNKDYLNMLKSDCDREVKDYLFHKVKQAEEIQENISRRGSTLMALAKCIVEVQNEFFLTGKKSLKPFRLTDAAERIGCHESTVSRALKDKYLQCCWGIYPLSYFFPKGLGLPEEEVAVMQVKQKIVKIIEGENKEKPYSDMKIAEILMEQGTELSRRTVAKYREEMNIANCRGRKVFH